MQNPRCLKLFESACRSEQTRKSYVQLLNYFLKWAEKDPCEDIGKYCVDNFGIGEEWKQCFWHYEEKCEVEKTTPITNSDIVCGQGTIDIDGVCQIEPNYEKPKVTEDEKLKAEMWEIALTKLCNTYDTEIENLKKYGYSDSLSKVFEELSPEEIIEELEDHKIEMGCKKKSVNWFSSIFDWFGGLFQ